MGNVLGHCKSATQMNVQVQFLLIQQHAKHEDHYGTLLLPIAVNRYTLGQNVWDT